MRRFIVCIHDATPAWARETGAMIQQLAPLVDRQLSLGVVPDWHGEWPLAEHPAYCALISRSSTELLLHGYFHERGNGSGPVSQLTGASDEMNGLDPDETRRTLERGQRVFTDVFGEPARGFLAPAWQRGHVRPGDGGVEHVLGFFALDTGTDRIPLATWSWDCGRWGFLGHVGHGIGRVLHSRDDRVPVIAIHPRDLHRGFWPKILELTRQLLGAGYQPTTVAGLLEEARAEVSV